MNHRKVGFCQAEADTYYGYIIVAIAFMIMLIAWGINYSFGVFFTPLLREFGWSRAMTSGAFSLGIFLEGFGGMFMGRICDRFGPRSVVTVCGILLGMGYMLMSQVSSAWHLYLFYGVLTGMGLSGSYVPLLSTVSKWFNRQRGLMTGIVASGMGAGTLVMTPFASWLISTNGWRFSYMTVGLAALIIIVVSAFFLRLPEKNCADGTSLPAIPRDNHQSAPIGPVDVKAILKTASFWLLCTAFMCWGMVTFAVLVHITPLAIEAGFSGAEAANILTIFGGSVFFAKIITGMIADRLGSKPAFVMGLGMLMAGLFLLLTTNSLWALYLFAIFYAFGYGCGSVIMPNIVAEMFGLLFHGILLGIVNFSACIGCALGPVAAGWLFDLTGNYTAAFVTATVIGAVTMIMTLSIDTSKRG
ncbi:MAG: MFS transporter [Deltaproteobacteria bacterium]|nr:MFS transporter [Deltaproteobacteria bacterium]